MSAPLLFVYGSLGRRARHPMHAVVRRAARYVGRATLVGALYDLGEYPGAALVRGGDGCVTGELYRLAAASSRAVLRVLDRYEGCRRGASQFRRLRVQVTTAAGGETRAWAYVLSHRPRLPSARLAAGVYAPTRR